MKKKSQFSTLNAQLNKVEWITLGEVATITIGEFVHQNKQDKSAEYPVYNGGTTPTGYYHKFNNTNKDPCQQFFFLPQKFTATTLRRVVGAISAHHYMPVLF